MGMFDYVVGVPEVLCPNCGKKVKGWQSKDGPCELVRLHFSAVDRFYTNCDKGKHTGSGCGRWIEFSVHKDQWDEVTAEIAIARIASGGVSNSAEYAASVLRELLKMDKTGVSLTRIRRFSDYTMVPER